MQVKMVITERGIEQLIARCELTFIKMGKKTLVCHATLPNGFEIVTSSACIDPERFDMKVGEEIAREHLKNKLWEMEGYRLHEFL